ncbi:hypothetical protein K438DRAFT_1764366 [Mycena galopus ATCC 62051]|nr:hypothetical protein K438DRAFT_1764366 [Mycena galopus ATCC 62051]
MANALQTYHADLRNIAQRSRFKKVDAAISDDSDSDDPHPNQLKGLKSAMAVFQMGGPEQAQAELDQYMNHLQSRENPHTMAHTDAVRRSYAAIVKGWTGTHISTKDHWLDSVIEQHAAPTVRCYAHGARGTKGRLHIKASTLKSFTNRLISQIGFFSHTANGDKNGMEVLCERGLFDRLQDLVYTLINELGLDRQQDEKLVYGDLELILILQTALTDSMKGNTRLAKLQTFCVLFLFFYSGLRPSSLGPSHMKYLLEGKYIRLGNVSIERLGPMDFRIKIKIENLKGYNGMTGKSLILSLSSPQRWTNVLFDINLYFLAYLVERKAILGVNSIDDIINGNVSSLTIDPAVADQPLFCAVNPGGKGLNLTGPMMATGLSAAVKSMAKAAGLVDGSAYGYRRGLANTLDIIVGKEAAELALAHEREGSIDSYIAGVANMPLTELMSGENEEFLNPLAVNRLRTQRMDSPAVSGLLAAIHSEIPRRILKKQNAKTLLPESGSIAKQAVTLATTISYKPGKEPLTAEEEKELAEDADLIKAESVRLTQVVKYKSLFKDHPVSGKYTAISTLAKFGKLATPIDPNNKQAILDALANARSAGTAATQVRSHVRRRILAKRNAAAAAQSFRGAPSALEFLGTVEERQTIREEFEGDTARANLVRSVMHLARDLPSSSSAPAPPVVSSPIASSSSALAAPAPAASAPIASSSSAPGAPVSSSSAPMASSSSVPATPAPASVVTSSRELHIDLEQFDDEDEELDPEHDKAVDMIRLCANRAKGRNQDAPRPPPRSSATDDEDDVDFNPELLTIGPLEGGVPVAHVRASDCDHPPEIDVPKLIEARIAYLRFLVAPLEADRRIAAAKVAGKGYKCHKCAMYVHDTSRTDKFIDTVDHFNRHLGDKHTPWLDLEIEAARQGDDGEWTFHCTAPNCSLSYPDMHGLQRHWKISCIDKARFNKIFIDHLSLKGWLGRKKTVSTNPGLVKQIKQFTPLEKDLLSACTTQADKDGVAAFLASLRQVIRDPPTDEEIDKILEDTARQRAL